MPVQIPTFFVPSSLAAGTGGLHPYETLGLSPPFILEDIFIRGGFRCLPSIAVRDKIPVACCKVGMLVYTPEDGGKIWKVDSITGPNVVWAELTLGGNYVGIDPIAVTPSSEIYIDPLRILPQLYDSSGVPLANQGDVVVLDSNLTPQWSTLSAAGFTGTREYETYTTAILDTFSSDTEDFDLEMGRFVALLTLDVDIPDIMIEAHSTEERLDENPYRFISTETLLSDTGITELTTGVHVRNRRYSFLANLEDPTKNKIYWRVRYLANTEASKDSAGAVIQYRQPTLKMCYMVFEP